LRFPKNIQEYKILHPFCKLLYAEIPKGKIENEMQDPELMNLWFRDRTYTRRPNVTPCLQNLWFRDRTYTRRPNVHPSSERVAPSSEHNTMSSKCVVTERTPVVRTSSTVGPNVHPSSEHAAPLLTHGHGDSALSQQTVPPPAGPHTTSPPVRHSGGQLHPSEPTILLSTASPMLPNDAAPRSSLSSHVSHIPPLLTGCHTGISSMSAIVT
jgi:hypothetical protein